VRQGRKAERRRKELLMFPENNTAHHGGQSPLRAADLSGICPMSGLP